MKHPVWCIFLQQPGGLREIPEQLPQADLGTWTQGPTSWKQNCHTCPQGRDKALLTKEHRHCSKRGREEQKKPPSDTCMASVYPGGESKTGLTLHKALVNIRAKRSHREDRKQTRPRV